MFRFIARRLLETIPALLVIVTATFFMSRLMPGGPFTSEKALSPEVQHNLDAFYGFDQPLYRQYFRYLGNLAQGDLGPSLNYRSRTVNEIIGEMLPTSLELGAWALLVALLVGLPLGVMAAVRRNRWIDYVSSSLALGGICIPSFVLGPILVLIFGIHLRVVNASGWNEPIDRVLPALVLGLFYAAYIARLTRGGMIDVLSQDYIRTARAKGASETRVILKHALRGGLAPVVSFLGPAIAGILTGSFVIETIFQIPGMGREFVSSASNRDYNLVLGTVIVYAALVVALNLAVDVVQVWLNPKLKFE